MNWPMTSRTTTTSAGLEGRRFSSRLRPQRVVIKGPGRLTPLAKPCSLLGRDSGFISSRVEETEARINCKYRNSLRSL